MIVEVNRNNKKEKELLHKVCLHQNSFFPLWKINFGEHWLHRSKREKDKPYETIVPFMHTPAPKTNQEAKAAYGFQICRHPHQKPSFIFVRLYSSSQISGVGWRRGWG